MRRLPEPEQRQKKQKLWGLPRRRQPERRPAGVKYGAAAQRAMRRPRKNKSRGAAARQQSPPLPSPPSPLRRGGCPSPSSPWSTSSLSLREQKGREKMRCPVVWKRGWEKGAASRERGKNRTEQESKRSRSRFRGGRERRGAAAVSDGGEKKSESMHPSSSCPQNSRTARAAIPTLAGAAECLS